MEKVHFTNVLRNLNNLAPDLDTGVVSFSGYETCEAELFWRTNYQLSMAAAAAIGATVSAASDFQFLRQGGTKENFQLDAKHLAATLNSHKYSKVNGNSIGELWEEFSGFYKCSDNRWIQLHCNYPHHKDNVLKALQLPFTATKDQLRTKLLTKTAEFWETELTSQDCCASFVRTVQEWKNHPQYQAIKDLPPFDILKIGETHPITAADSSHTNPELPLSSIRVLDLSRVLAGPVACKLMARLGANVLKIVSPKLPYVASLVPDTNFGKRSTFLDLNQNEDKEKLIELIKGCDVFFQAYRPGSLAARGFGPEEIAKINPGIIYVSLSAYSHEGPWSHKRGFDSLVQSATGIVSEQSVFEGKSLTEDTPSHWPVSAQDYVCGFLSAYATILALRQRLKAGGSYHIRISLVQTGNWIRSLRRSATWPEKSLQEEDIKEYLDKVESEWGSLQYLKPVVTFPGFTPSTPTSLGACEPEW